MDFLKDIVKEIGDEYTKLASDIDETESYVDTGSYIFNGLVSGSIFGGVSGNKITAIAGMSLLLEKLSSVLSSRTSLILTLMVIVYILTLKPLLTNLFSQVVGLIFPVLSLSML